MDRHYPWVLVLPISTHRGRMVLPLSPGSSLEIWQQGNYSGNDRLAYTVPMMRG